MQNISDLSWPRRCDSSPMMLMAKHLFSSLPPRSWVKMVPNMISIKQKSTMMSNMMGKLLRIVETKLLMPGILLMVLRGLRSLITLIAEMFCWASWIETHPKITTKKSS